MQTHHAYAVVGCAVILDVNLKQLPAKNTLQILIFWKVVWILMFLAHCHIIDWAELNFNTSSS